MNCTHEIDEPLPALINGQPVCDDCATANEEGRIYCLECGNTIDRTDAPWRTTYCGLYCAAIAVTIDDDPAIDDEPPYGSFPEER